MPGLRPSSRMRSIAGTPGVRFWASGGRDGRDPSKNRAADLGPQGLARQGRATDGPHQRGAQARKSNTSGTLPGRVGSGLRPRSSQLPCGSGLWPRSGSHARTRCPPQPASCSARPSRGKLLHPSPSRPRLNAAGQNLVGAPPRRDRAKRSEPCGCPTTRPLAATKTPPVGVASGRDPEAPAAPVSTPTCQLQPRPSRGSCCTPALRDHGSMPPGRTPWERRLGATGRSAASKGSRAKGSGGSQGKPGQRETRDRPRFSGYSGRSS